MSKALKDCCRFQEGYVNPSQTIREYFGNDVKWLRAVDLNNDEVFATSEKLSTMGYKSAGASAFMFPTNSLAISTGNTVGFGKGDILLGNIRPYFKKIWLSDIQGGCSPDVLVIRSIVGNETEFLFASLARDDFFTYDMAGKKGSKMPRGDKDHIMRYPIAYSKDHVLEFCAMVRDWYKKISEIYYENQQLSSLRDFLLPLLMNGQVKVESSIITGTK